MNLKSTPFCFALIYCCTQPHTMSRPWSDLPMTALTLAFEKLPQRKRSGSVSCVALVCSRWAEAAAAATRVIVGKCPNTDSLQTWLRSRGSSVNQIQLFLPSGAITSLPCPRLEHLVLEDSIVNLRPNSQLVLDLSAATGLTTLMLNGVTFQGRPDLAGVLSALPNLRCLSLYKLRVQHTFHPASTASPGQDGHAARQHAVPALLSLLDASASITGAGMQLVCQLTKLSALHLCSMGGITAAGLAGLANLQELQFLALRDLACDISWTAVPAFRQLTTLTTLVLHWPLGTHIPKFDPAILAHMTQLQQLVLSNAIPARGAAALLFRLSRMPKLQLLELKVKGLLCCPAGMFSALTASSVLRSLSLQPHHTDWMYALSFSRKHWKHMFGPKLRLQQLTVLDTGMVIPGEAADLDRLVSSCRHLRGLSMCCSDGLLLTPLLRLKALNMLWVNGVTDRCTALSLAQLSGLTGLRALLITEPCQLTDYEVCSLTALKRLTCLTLTNVDSWRFSKAMQQRLRPFKEFLHDGFPCCVCWTIRNTAPAGAPPNVWSQLLGCLKGSKQRQQQRRQQQLWKLPLAAMAAAAPILLLLGRFRRPE